MGHEKQVENSIKEYTLLMNWIVKKIHSGAIYQKKGRLVYKIQLESEGTTDLYVEFNWVWYWVEVKKNKEEYEKWLKLEKRFYWEWKPLPVSKTYKREIAQFKEKKFILDRWGRHILTYSLKDFINKYQNYDSSIQELKETPRV